MKIPQEEDMWIRVNRNYAMKGANPTQHAYPVRCRPSPRLQRQQLEPPGLRVRAYASASATNSTSSGRSRWTVRRFQPAVRVM